MFNVCPGCGEYSDAKAIDPDGPYAICPFCGHRHRFVRLPLFVVTGASGAGKTTLCLALAPIMSECIVLESDILWGPEFDTPDDQYRRYRNLWLRLAKNINQAGRPVVLCGTVVPDQFEPCPERRYLAEIHYLALVSDDETLVHRLRSRPRWRQSSHDEFIERMSRFNQWLKDNADKTNPAMTLLDTSRLTIEESVEHITGWIRRHWPVDSSISP